MLKFIGARKGDRNGPGLWEFAEPASIGQTPADRPTARILLKSRKPL